MELFCGHCTAYSYPLMHLFPLYFQVNVCETSENEENPQFNAKIMAYLRKHVPKMFQVSLLIIHILISLFSALLPQ